MPTGLNGMPVLPQDDPALVWVTIPGTGARVRVHRAFAPIAAYVGARWDREVERIVPGECWGYAYRPSAAASGRWSSHATGYALDLNSNHAGAMLWGDPVLKATPTQLRAMAQIKASTGLLWGGPAQFGGDYAQPRYWDPMHWDIPRGVDGAVWCAALTARLTLTPPAPTPAPDQNEDTMIVIQYGRSAWRLLTGDRLVGISADAAAAFGKAGVRVVALPTEDVDTLARELRAEV
jgi:hypothetical protein